MSDIINFDTDKHYTNFDYFNFQIVGNFKATYFQYYLTKLFSILYLNEDEYKLCDGGTYNFNVMRKYTDNTTMLLEPILNSQRRDGRDYFVFKMSGIGCREFEQRGGSFFELIKYLNYLNTLVVFNNQVYELSTFDNLPFDSGDIDYSRISANVTRVDISMDIVNNPFFNINSLKKKIESVSYVSRFRAMKNLFDDNEELEHKSHSLSESFGIFNSDDFNVGEKVDVQDTKYGYSARFGSKQNLELNIYDKKSEVFVKTGEVLPYKELVRYELRFFNNHAYSISSQLVKFDSFKQLDKFFVEKLSSVLKLKDISYFEFLNINGSESASTHYSRANDWIPYIRMLSYVFNGYDKKSKYKLIPPENVPSTDPFLKTKTWLKEGVYQAMTKVVTFDEDNNLIDEIYRDSILKSFNNGFFNISELNSLNKNRILNGLSELTILDWLRIAKEKYISYGGNGVDFKISYELFEKYYGHFLNWTSEFFEKKID